MLVTVRGRAGGLHQYQCDPGENILRAGLSRGIALPYACASGSCGTCKARLISGQVQNQWPDAPGQGFCRESNELLTCQSVVHEDCTLEVARFGRGDRASAPQPSHFMGRLRDRRRLTSDVAAFDVQLEHPLEFHAGQFALLEVPGVSQPRAYTMTNFEPQAGRLSFVVKRKPGGAVSEWLFGERAFEGSLLRLFGPLGHAVFHRDVRRHLVCIAGGSGIAGMLSILRSAIAVDHFSERTGRLFFGVRTARDLFFLDELATLRALNPHGIEITVALSEDDVPDGLQAAYPSLLFTRGRVDQVAWAALRGRIDAVRDQLRAYVAGPGSLVNASIRLLLRDGRLAPAEIRYDAFN